MDGLALLLALVLFAEICFAGPSPRDARGRNARSCCGWMAKQGKAGQSQMPVPPQLTSKKSVVGAGVVWASKSPPDKAFPESGLCWRASVCLFF